MKKNSLRKFKLFINIVRDGKNQTEDRSTTKYIERSFDRAMRFLGVKYDIKGDTLSILDTERLRKGLKDYELRGE